MRDARVDSLIRKTLAAQSHSGPEPCVSENLMAAYLEKSLTQQESNAVESHLADCTACREILALALKLQSEDESASLPAVPRGSKKTLFRFSIPIPVLGALLVCIAAGALFFRWPHRTPETAVKEKQVAELRSPDQPAAQPPSAVATDLDASKLARIDAPVAGRGANAVKAESKMTAPFLARPAALPPFEELGSTTVNKHMARALKKEAVSTGQIVAGTAGASAAPAANEPSAARDEVTVPSNAAPASLGLAALPAGALLGPEKGVQAGEGESAGPGRDDTAAALLSQSGDKATTGRGGATGVPSPAPASLSRAALPPSVVSGTEKNLQAKTEAGKPENSTAKQPADAIVLARTQQPITRPHLYAASNRIATSLYETESVESWLQFAIKNLSANLKKAESRKIGDRVFYKHRGFSIDGQCMKHAENPIVSITAPDPVYTSILEKYPEISSILPAAIYWESKTYLLK